MKRLIFALAFLFTACVYASEAEVITPSAEAEVVPPIEWAGHPLVRSRFVGRHNGVAVPQNVITPACTRLFVYYENWSGYYVRFSINEQLEVYLDGAWYTLVDFLPQRERPITFPPRAIDHSIVIETVRHTIHFPHALPPGRYRLTDTFYNWGMQMHENKIAYFWVTEPGAERPSESETTGAAQPGDVILTVTSMNTARPQVSNVDEIFFFHTEVLTGRNFLITRVFLDRYASGNWESVPFEHANYGLQFGWTTSSNELFLHQPLAPGRYRVTLTMNAFNLPHTMSVPGDIFPQYEFEVVAEEGAPEPAWDAARLLPSQITELGDRVTMTLASDIITRENPMLEIVLEVDRGFMYGQMFQIEVNLDGEWFQVPMHGFFTLEGLIIDENTPLAYRTIRRNFVRSIGVVPPGHYRIIKKFNAWGHGSPPQNIERQTIAAEFTVTEILGT